MKSNLNNPAQLDLVAAQNFFLIGLFNASNLFRFIKHKFSLGNK